MVNFLLYQWCRLWRKWRTVYQTSVHGICDLAEKIGKNASFWAAATVSVKFGTLAAATGLHTQLSLSPISI